MTLKKIAFSSDWREYFVFFLLLWLLSAVSLKNADRGGIHEDFQAFYNAGTRLNNHQPLYDLRASQSSGPLEFARFQFDYTPTVAILSCPYAKLSTDSAFKLWIYTQQIFLVFSMLLFVRFTSYGLSDKPAILIILITGFRFWPTVCNFDVGQCNFALLAIICGQLLCQRESKFDAFGFLVGVGASIKYWFIATGIFLLLQRKWKAFALSMIAFTSITTLEFAIIGFGEVVPFFQVNAKILTHTSKVHPTQSVLGVGPTLFSNTAYATPLYHNEMLGSLIGPALALALVGAAFYLINNAISTRTNRALKYSLALQTGVMILPACNIVYYIFSLPALWSLIALPRRSPIPKLTMIIGIVLYVLMTRWILPTSGRFSISYLLWGLSLWSLLALSLYKSPKVGNASR